MIVIKGTWKCFHCGIVNPNTLIECRCGNTKKFSENGMERVGMDGAPTQPKNKGDKETYRKLGDLYNRAQEKLQPFLCKFFRFIEKLDVYKGKAEEGVLYYGFTTDEHHYTIRRDEI